jgi:hypothetical protein
MFALLAALLLGDPCSFGMPFKPAGSIVVAVTLEGPSNKKLPVIAADALSRMSVAARVEAIRKGAFALHPGLEMELAVHSIALSFGSDYRGERYEVGFEPVGKGSYRVVSITPDESATFELHGVVIAGKPQPGDHRIAAYGKEAVRVRVTSAQGAGLNLRPGDVAILPAPAQSEGKTVCAFGLYRASRPDRPYRLLRRSVQ